MGQLFYLLSSPPEDFGGGIPVRRSSRWQM
nr:MAG TPA: hypothetical protein [Caudoviricetes sp.]